MLDSLLPLPSKQRNYYALCVSTILVALILSYIKQLQTPTSLLASAEAGRPIVQSLWDIPTDSNALLTSQSQRCYSPDSYPVWSLNRKVHTLHSSPDHSSSQLSQSPALHCLSLRPGCAHCLSPTSGDCCAFYPKASGFPFSTIHTIGFRRSPACPSLAHCPAKVHLSTFSVQSVHRQNCVCAYIRTWHFYACYDTSDGECTVPTLTTASGRSGHCYL